MTRAEREEIKEIVHAELIGRAMPATHLYDAVIHLPTGNIYLLATSPKVTESFKTLYDKTFDGRITPVITATKILDYTTHPDLDIANVQPIAFNG